jgi:hypothetical protein
MATSGGEFWFRIQLAAIFVQKNTLATFATLQQTSLPIGGFSVASFF